MNKHQASSYSSALRKYVVVKAIAYKEDCVAINDTVGVFTKIKFPEAIVKKHKTEKQTDRKLNYVPLF